MEKNSNKYSRPKKRRARRDLTKCIDCQKTLTEDNWRKSLRYYKRYCCNYCWTTRQKNYSTNDPDSSKNKYIKRKKTMSEWSEDRKKIETEKRYERQLKVKYNMSLEEYYSMLEKQNKSCKICKTTVPEGQGNRFHVDHCHFTGKIRGLLCHRCNLMIGNAKDSIEILQNAINYLTEIEENNDQIRPDHKIENRVKENGKSF